MDAETTERLTQKIAAAAPTVVSRTLLTMGIGDEAERQYLEQELSARLFELAIRALHTLRNEGALFAWLMTIAKWESLKIAREWRKRRRKEVVADIEWIAERSGSDGGSLDEIFHREIFRTVVERIPDPINASLFVLMGLEELSASEAAEVTGLSANQCDCRFRRTKRMLQKAWSPSDLCAA